MNRALTFLFVLLSLSVLIPSSLSCETDWDAIAAARKAKADAEASFYAAVADAALTERNRMDYYDALYYRVDFAYDLPVDHSFIEVASSNRIRAMMTQDGVSAFELHFADLFTVQAVTVHGVPAGFTHADGLLTVDLPGVYDTGDTLTVGVDYAGTVLPRLEDGLKFELHEGVPVVFTMCSPRGARKWQPCKDVPWDKADGADIIITHPDDYISASNGLLVSEVNNGDGTITAHWHESHPVCTYLMSLAVTNYEIQTQQFTWQGQTLPVSHYVYPELADDCATLFGSTPQMLGFLSGIYGEYPFMDEKYGHAVCTDLGALAMEHQTCTSFQSAYINDEDAVYTVVHEMAHQWAGDCLSLGSWGHVWLKEGFATYSEALWVENQMGTADFLAYMSALDTGSQLDPPVYRPADGTANEIFNWTVYAKGAWVLHMLRHQMGDAAFFTAIHNYMTDPALMYGVVMTSDLVDHCEAVYGDDLDWFLQPWLTNEGRPLYEYTLYQYPYGGDTMVGIRSYPEDDSGFPALLPFVAGTDSCAVIVQPGVNHRMLDFAATEVTPDPDDRVLDGGFSYRVPLLYPPNTRDGKVGLIWAPFFDPLIDGFHVWRSTDGENWTQITAQPADQGGYLDEGLDPAETYYYRIAAVYDGARLSGFSNIIETQPVDFPLTPGVTVVDRTAEYASESFPDDDTQDMYYDQLLYGWTNAGDWDMATQGEPPLAGLSASSLVLWHCDDIQQTPFTNQLNTMRTYVLGGGNVVVSGMKYLSGHNLQELEAIFGITDIFFSQTADFAGAIGMVGQPDIEVDPEKVPLPNWGENLAGIYRFQPLAGTQVLFRYDSATDDPEWENQPCAVRTCGGNVVLLGFPLYYMRQEQAKDVVDWLMAEFDIPVGAEDQEIPVPQALSMSVAPNPFNPQTTIRFRLPEAGAVQLRVYNIRGQLVSGLIDSRLEAGSHEVVWDAGGLSSGVYLARLETPSGVRTARVVVVK